MGVIDMETERPRKIKVIFDPLGKYDLYLATVQDCPTPVFWIIII